MPGKLSRVLTVFGIAAAATILGPVSNASAGGYGCNGDLVYSADAKGVDSYSNTVVAHIYAYWDGTYNCEVAVKKVFVGTSTRMELTLWSNYGEDTDSGYFSYYAGPVKVKAVNSCIWEEVDMWDTAGRNIAQAYNYGKHNCS
ncbi:hypothetical protein RKD23_004562 [Streptomyces sp. SAI-170]|uniref:hypothetical protein n=1 Tax=Streptomyces sp. SAI-170 TaxID=3377729 RepID=UPI003C79DAE5